MEVPLDQRYWVDARGKKKLIMSLSRRYLENIRKFFRTRSIYDEVLAQRIIWVGDELKRRDRNNRKRKQKLKHESRN